MARLASGCRSRVGSRLRGAGAGVEADAVEIAVRGMTCAGCAARVGDAARSVAGVSGVDVDLKRGTVRVSGGSPDLGAVARAIESAGYDVVI